MHISFAASSHFCSLHSQFSTQSQLLLNPPFSYIIVHSWLPLLHCSLASAAGTFLLSACSGQNFSPGGTNGMQLPPCATSMPDPTHMQSLNALFSHSLLVGELEQLSHLLSLHAAS